MVSLMLVLFLLVSVGVVRLLLWWLMFLWLDSGLLISIW